MSLRGEEVPGQFVFRDALEEIAEEAGEDGGSGGAGRIALVMKVTEKDVAYVAELANLELTGEGRGRLLRDLTSSTVVSRTRTRASSTIFRKRGG